MFLTHISHTYLMMYGGIRRMMKYMLQNLNVDHENNKLNRNVHDMVRSLLYYENFYNLKQGLI